MDAALIRRVDALRRPLELAAQDNFRGVKKVTGLGHALRTACDAVIAVLDEAAVFEQWRATLAHWEALDEHRQAAEVAKGMRLLARFPRAVRAPVSRANAPGLRAESIPHRASASLGGPPTAASTARASSTTTTRATSAPAKATRKVKSVDSKLAPSADPPRTPRAARAKATTTAEPPADPLAESPRSLPGIGPAFAQRLADKGLHTVEDLLWMVPRRYDDVRDAKTLVQLLALPEGSRATFVAQVTSARMIFARGRRWAEVKLTAHDPPDDFAVPATALVRWFNVFAGIEQRMPVGSRVTLNAVVKLRGGRLELANPDIIGIEIAGVAGKELPKILARYPDVQGVPPGRLRAACAAACARVADSVDDGVPPSVEMLARLPSLGETLATLHQPASEISPAQLAQLNAGTSDWQKRLAFGELFALGVAITLRRRERRQDAAVPCVPPKGDKAGIHDVLAPVFPFVLTGAQRRSIGELCADVGAAVPMNRLLQGDVGAGKTAVAFAAAVQVARAKRQTAVMAPTELLAEQHFETWTRWAAKLGGKRKLRIELLTASTPRPLRATLLALLAAGEIDIVIGTHALLAEAVGFGALGLVVIDEQHRFGVAQRAKLRDKGDGQGAPHLLVMTATPIPRTLALTAYGDLDLSVLDEMPPGRLPVATQQLSGATGARVAWKLIAERAAAGERAYVVCPKVEASEDDDAETKAWADATTTAAQLAKVLPELRIGLVHGRLDALARDHVMRAFKQGELEILVATTVIEVGVDVPAATVMVVLDADRFGLAQLHQLRGRVGRGGGEAHCLLVSNGALGPDAESRLTAMVSTHDGFQIAEYDLSLRGPGELLGPRQAGVPRLRFGDLQQHTALLLEARRCAEQILDGDPALTHPDHAALRRAIDRRFAQHVYGAESG